MSNEYEHISPALYVHLCMLDLLQYYKASSVLGTMFAGSMGMAPPVDPEEEKRAKAAVTSDVIATIGFVALLEIGR